MYSCNKRYGGEPFPDHVCHEENLVSCDSCDARGCEECLELKSLPDPDCEETAALCPGCYEKHALLLGVGEAKMRGSAKTLEEAIRNGINDFNISDPEFIKKQPYFEKIMQYNVSKYIQNRLSVLTATHDPQALKGAKVAAEVFGFKVQESLEEE